jgi:hypothetical protein
MSEVNKNRKIELAAARGKVYPTTGAPPVAVFRELQVRSFEYVLLMPGDDGYTEMLAFTVAHPSIGRGVKRVITDISNIRQIWSRCPLIREGE